MNKVKEVRRKIRDYKSITWYDRRFLDDLSKQIVREGIDPRDLSLDETFAVIFLVARVVHRHLEVGREERIKASRIKLMLQLSLLSHVQKGVCKVSINHSKQRYFRTIEVTYGIWSTHIPADMHTALYHKVLQQHGSFT